MSQLREEPLKALGVPDDEREMYLSQPKAYEPAQQCAASSARGESLLKPPSFLLRLEGALRRGRLEACDHCFDQIYRG